MSIIITGVMSTTGYLCKKKIGLYHLKLNVFIRQLEIYYTKKSIISSQLSSYKNFFYSFRIQ